MFWPARRMAFIHCSPSGTALSWYIRLNNTYKQDWSAFVQTFKKTIFFSEEGLLCTSRSSFVRHTQ